jgi:hypothetical protein
MDGKRAIGRLGSPQARLGRGDPPLGRGDPRQELDRFLGYALGRSRFFDAPRVPFFALAAVEAASGSCEEASGTHDL